MEPRPIEKDLKMALEAAPGLTALAGNRIFALRIPDGTMLPCLTFQRTTGRPLNHLKGHAASMVRMQINVWAKNYEEGKNISLEVGRAIHQSWLTAWLEEELEIFDDNYYRLILEYTIKQSGGFEK